jgi:hypothetical protein
MANTITITGPAELVQKFVEELILDPIAQYKDVSWYVKDDGNPEAVEIAPIVDPD